MRFRKLLVVWSVFWAIAAVLLLVLWIRSYRWSDSVVVYLSKWSFDCASVKGQLLASGPRSTDEWPAVRSGDVFEWQFNTGPVDLVYKQPKPFF